MEFLYMNEVHNLELLPFRDEKVVSVDGMIIPTPKEVCDLRTAIGFAMLVVKQTRRIAL